MTDVLHCSNSLGPFSYAWLLFRATGVQSQQLYRFTAALEKMLLKGYNDSDLEVVQSSAALTADQPEEAGQDGEDEGGFVDGQFSPAAATPAGTALRLALYIVLFLCVSYV